MKICSFNIKNNFFHHTNKNDNLYNFIKNYHIDILGTQEYIYRDFKKFSLDNYKCYGKGRLKLNSVYNETNAIITNISVKSNKTYRLPWIFTTFPRIMTVITFKHLNNDYLVINTHLDYLHYISRRKQLKYIYSYILKKYKDYKIVLMGDFNMNSHDILFKKFINLLYELGIKRLEIDDKSFKLLNHPIDHIFVSSDIKIIDKKVIVDDRYDISDHYPIYVEIK